MTSKRIILGALCAFAVACGGDDKPDPAARHFDYGAPVAPTYYEQSAAEQGEYMLSDGAAYRTSDDPLVAESAGGSLPSLPDSLGATMFGGDGGVTYAAPGVSKGFAATLGGLTVSPQALGDGFDDPTCVTLVPGRITYDHCTMTGLDVMSIGVNGWMGRTGDVIAWDLDTTMTMADVDFTMTTVMAASGSVTITASTIAGQARTDISASGNADGMRFRMGYTTLADLDLTYQPEPAFCVTGGTLEVRRVWTERMAGMPTDGEYADQGVKLTWTGCGVVQVARSR